LTCPPKVVPIVKLVFVENEGDTEYDTQTVHT